MIPNFENGQKCYPIRKVFFNHSHNNESNTALRYEIALDNALTDTYYILEYCYV